MRIFQDHQRIRLYYFFALIFSLVLIPSLSQATEENKQITPLKNDSLSTIIVSDYYPYTYVNKHGEPDGFSVELAKAVCKIMGRNLNITVDTWYRATSALKSGEIDFLPMMAFSKERDKAFDFSVSHTIAYDALFTRAGGEIQSTKELTGKRIIVMKNDQAHEHLMSTRAVDPENLILVDSLPEGLRRLSAGEGDVAIMPKLVGLMVSMELHLDNLNTEPNIIEAYNRPFSFAVKEGNQALLERLVQGLDIAKRTGQYDALYRKWFGVFDPEQRSLQSVLKYIAGIFIFLIVISGFFAIWSFFLKRQVSLRTKDIAARERFLNRVIDQSPFAIWISDAHGTLQHANPALKAFLNLTDEQLVGKYNVLNDPLVERQGLMPLIRTVFEEGKAIHFTCDWDGNDIPTLDLKCSASVSIQATMFPIHNPEGELTNVVLNWIDITDKKKAEEEVRTLNRDLELRVRKRTAELEEVNKELENFVYSVSHDLRAPLRSISGFSQIINKRHKSALNEEGRHYFENIVKASAQMEELINDLLQFFRLGKKGFTAKPVSLDDILDITLETLSHQTEDLDGRIDRPENLPAVQGDERLVSHIFINLLENALKYRDPNRPPVINIWFEKDDTHVVVSVADNGIGIAPEYHEKIFNIFQRLHSQSQYPGTGIGLTAVRKAAQILGGQVWVESELNKGSVFTVQFLR